MLDQNFCILGGDGGLGLEIRNDELTIKVSEGVPNWDGTGVTQAKINLNKESTEAVVNFLRTVLEQ